LALIVQEPLGGFLIGATVTPLIALAFALYACGRQLAGRWELAAAALGVVLVSATRIAVDPAAGEMGQAALTFVAVSLPLLVGRWVRGQGLLQRRLAAQAQRLERDRARDARAAAEEERLRIADDLQAAIAGALRDLLDRVARVRTLLAGGDGAAAGAELEVVAATAREALADVRRVLGILRRDGAPPSLAPAEASAARAPAPPPAAVRPDAPVLAARAWPLAALVFAGLLVELPLLAAPGQRAAATLTALPIAAALLLRTRRPLTAGLAVLGAIWVQSMVVDLDRFPLSDIAAVVFAAYAVGTTVARRPVGAMVLLGVAAGVHAAVYYPDGVVPAVLGGVVAPWTIGRVVRGHRALTEQGHADAARADRAHRRDAQAAVTAERMRIARELHDAVAHNLSVVAIQAGGAAPLAERDGPRAAEIAELIETVAREALAELERLAAPGPDGAPEASLRRVEELADRARDAGLPVELRVEGPRRALPAGLDLAAYRIVQEALANAAKHAGAAPTSVSIRYDRDAVAVEVTDRGSARARPAGRGHGLVGIRERVTLYGGTVDIGPQRAGGFRVRARLPTR
ncbi:MAG TPA: histidine kinase, partial [Solirubrobacter sp.]|nr:histidine kinase [Solirubrobacter sp.]